MHAKTAPIAEPQIAPVRGFNRLYTRIIGTLREGLQVAFGMYVTCHEPPQKEQQP